MKQGFLLIAHGARDPAWAKPFDAVADALRERVPDAIVRVAYLDHLAPNIDAASGALVREGCDCIEVAPMFLGAGGHVQRDVPAAVDALRKRHPRVQFRLQTTIGEADAVIAAMAASVADAAVRTTEAAPAASGR